MLLWTNTFQHEKNQNNDKYVHPLLLLGPCWVFKIYSRCLFYMYFNINSMYYKNGCTVWQTSVYIKSWTTSYYFVLLCTMWLLVCMCKGTAKKCKVMTKDYIWIDVCIFWYIYTSLALCIIAVFITRLALSQFVLIYWLQQATASWLLENSYVLVIYLMTHKAGISWSFTV